MYLMFLMIREHTRRVYVIHYVYGPCSTLHFIIHPSIHPRIYPYLYLSIHPSIYLSIYILLSEHT